MKRNNIKHVADVAGVSAMTVSRYFNQPEKLSDKAKAKVEAAINSLKYMPNQAARTLLHGNSQTLAFLGHFEHHFDFSILRGIEDFAYSKGYLLFLCNTDSARLKERFFINGLIRQQVDGVILNPRYDRENLDLLLDHHIPTVVVDPKISDTPFDVVRGQSYEAGYELTSALLDQGFQRVAFIGGPKGVTSLEQRLEGYRTAMQERGYNPITELGEYSRSSGFNITTNMFSAQPPQLECLIAANGLVARGILEALKALKIRSPTDIAVAAFDATDEYFELGDFLVANSVQPSHKLGQKAAEMLIERIEGYHGTARDISLPFELATYFYSKETLV